MGAGNARPGVRWWLLALVVAALAGAFWLAQRTVRIETDITASIPQSDPVLAATRRVLAHHPALERIVLDAAFADGHADADGLVAVAERTEERLRRSNLFQQVGLAETGEALAALYSDLPGRLPGLFSATELRDEVAPRLEPARIAEALQRRFDELAQLQGVGQAAAIAADPLGLRELVLARLQALLPPGAAHVVRNHLVSADDRHVLILLHPQGAGTDTETARRLRGLFHRVAAELELEQAAAGQPAVSLAAVGGFRAALDNEETIRADTQRAIWFATIGIAVLLLACFPRPLLGLLALIPAAAGVVLALLVYSWIRPSISALALGFGGALVSITVDQGIAYLLFLDRPCDTRGKEAAHEVRSVGLFATLTTVGAFFALHFSGYALLEELGLFAGLAVALAFLFIHFVFPYVFPALPAARRAARLPLERWLGRATTNRGWSGPVVAALAAVGFLAAGRPPFVADLQAMNHVGADTLADEARVKAVWGDVLRNVYLALDADTSEGFRQLSDRLLELVESERRQGTIAGAFVPSMVVPGPDRARRNVAAWTAFWTPERRDAVRKALERGGAELGFTVDAFSPFLAALERTTVPAMPMPADLGETLGVSRRADGRGWLWLGSLTPGAAYDGARLFERARLHGATLFDPQLFGRRLGDHLGSAFSRMLVIIGATVVALIVLLFLEPRVILLTLLPLVFALCATLGGLSLLGRPLDIPSLLLAVVVFGMGVDYSLYFVHTSQRLLDEHHPSFGPMRLTVFLAAASTLLGMLSLAFAKHPVLRSAGIAGTLGIAGAALGALLILPPFLRRMFPGPEAIAWVRRDGEPLARRVMRRYRGLSAHARLFAWFKLRLDPLFARLLKFVGQPRTILDVGCGQGVPGACLLAGLPEPVRIFGVEPDAARARIAARAFGPYGTAVVGAAPDLPAEPAKVDCVLILDVIHQLDDAALAATLRDVRGRLEPGGRLVLRATIPGPGKVPWLRRLETARLRRIGGVLRFRTADELCRAVKDADFGVKVLEPSAPGREDNWIVAVACRPEDGTP